MYVSHGKIELAVGWPTVTLGWENTRIQFQFTGTSLCWIYLRKVGSDLWNNKLLVFNQRFPCLRRLRNLARLMSEMMVNTIVLGLWRYLKDLWWGMSFSLEFLTTNAVRNLGWTQAIPALLRLAISSAISRKTEVDRPHREISHYRIFTHVYVFCQYCRRVGWKLHGRVAMVEELEVMEIGP